MALTGLAALKAKKQADAERAEARNRPKAEWLTSVFPKPPAKGGVGDEVLAVFLQELDDAAPGYREDRGVGLVEVEHQAPGRDGFKKRASCTLESEGRCLPDERHTEAYKNDPDYEGDWRQRTNFYINVAVDIDGEWKTMVLTRNFNSSFFEDLMEIAEDEGTITDKVYRIKKSGSGTKTAWKLKATDDEVPDLSDAEVFNLEETVLRKIPYVDQPRWYLGGVTTASTDEDRPTGAPATADDEW